MLKRVNKELKDIETREDEIIISYGDITNKECNIRIYLFVDKNVLYNDSVFISEFRLPSDYPFKPPKVSFKVNFDYLINF